MAVLGRAHHFIMLDSSFILLSLCHLLTADPAFVCYPKVGCFNNQYPWHSFARPVPLPESPDNISTFMYYYNRELPKGAMFPIFPIMDVPFGWTRKNMTFVLIHGFRANGRRPWITKLKDTLLQKRDANVLVVDYGLQNFSYEQTVANGRIVARLVSLVLEALSIHPSSLHIIGHSMGAQIASFLAENLREIGLQIGQITGLDPAGPFFENSPAQTRIDKTDAKFVDILHTSPGPRGILYPTGHIDFYFNGDQLQPGCLNNPDPVLCSHNISANYYQDAIERECLFGYPAEFKPQPNATIFPGVILKNDKTKIPVGLETVNHPQRGIFLVHTRPQSPFCDP